MEELSECISAGNSTEQEFDERLLVETLNTFLRSLSQEKRQILIRRYWYLSPVKEIAMSTTTDIEPMEELSMEAAVADERFGNLFPASILEGYELQDTVVILNDMVLVASFYKWR